MFANGGSAISLSSELIDYAESLDIDPIGKTSEELKNEINLKLQQQTQEEQPGFFRSYIFDYKDPIDYLSTGLLATGIGAGAGAALRAANIAKKAKKAKDATTQFVKQNPIKTGAGASAVVGGADLFIDTDVQETLQAPDLITEELTKLSEEERKQTATQNKKKREEAAAKAAKDEKDKINETLRILQTRAGEFDEAEKERISQERRDNAFTLMQEIGSAMVETGQIDRGLALGATRASKRISEEQLAEKLAEDELKRKMAEEDKLSATEKNKIVTTYADAQLHLTNMDFINNELEKMIGLVESGSVTGGKGLLGRALGKIKGFAGFGDEVIEDATQAKQIGTFIRTQLVRELLNESGRTISNLDRQLIDEIVGDVADLGEGRGAILKSLERIRQRINSSTAKSRNTVEFYKKEYGAQVPNLSIFDQQERYTPPTETEVSVTADDVIQ